MPHPSSCQRWEQRMKEPCKEGVASHLGPESCVVSRKAGQEALTGVQAGWAMEPRYRAYFRGPTQSSNAEGNRMGVDTARRPSPCAVEDPRHAWKLNVREPGDPRGAHRKGNRGAGGKAVDQGERRRGQPESDAESGNRVTGSGRCAGGGNVPFVVKRLTGSSLSFSPLPRFCTLTHGSGFAPNIRDKNRVR